MQSAHGRHARSLLALAFGVSACSGQIEDGAAAFVLPVVPAAPVVENDAGAAPASGGRGATADMDPPEPECNASGSFASARISLISDDQYINVVRDVFGVQLSGEISVVRSANGLYNVSESSAVSNQTTAQAYLAAAAQVAADPALAPCGDATVEVDCMRAFLEDKLPRAWRRPVDAAEIDALIGLFELGLQDSPEAALRVTMQALLSSPNFLYRAELGDDPTGTSGSTVLSPHEVASALSFALTNSSPDPELWSRAEDGSILDLPVLRDEVERIMATDAARANLQKKVSYYLSFEKLASARKDEATFPEFAALRDTLYDSAQRFLADVLWEGQWGDLFTSRRMYVNQAMAEAYGIPGVTSETLVAVETTGAGYNAGVLTQPALLASSNHHAVDDDIVHRGLWIYDNVACGFTIGAPPANADEVFATLTGTPRQKALARDALPQCGACHVAFDPFGLASQKYDPIGRFRTEDPDLGGPIDDSATIIGLGADIDGPVRGMHELAQRFAGGRRAADCAATRLATFTLDHNPDVERSCALQQAKDDFYATGSFSELFKALLASPAFLTRDLATEP